MKRGKIVNSKKHVSNIEEHLPKFYKLYIRSTLLAASFIVINLLRLQILSDSLQLLILILMLFFLNFYLMKGMQYNQIKDNMIQLHASENMSEEIQQIKSRRERVIYTLLPFTYVLIINLIIMWSYTNNLNVLFQITSNLLIFILLSIELFKGMQSKAQVHFILQAINSLLEDDDE